jgi:hypothetical protein
LVSEKEISIETYKKIEGINVKDEGGYRIETYR